jgi:hypothetical protein
LSKLTEIVPPGSQSTANVSIVGTTELVNLINDVQTALRTL